VTEQVRSTCATCGNEVASKYCPICGEKRLGKDDLTLRHLIAHAIETISNTDGRVFGSLRDLALRPGVLTAAYIQGRRKPYIGPLQLFLIINVLFFAMQSLSGWRIFSTPLDSHLHDQIYSGVARPLVDDRLTDRQTTLESYRPLFNQAAALNAKTLIILMVPPFAVFASLLFRRRDRTVVTHVVFAIHFFAFVLLIYSLLLSVAFVATRLLGFSGSVLDGWLSLIHLAIYTAYLYGAAGTAYGVTGFARVLKVALLAVAVPVILLGYRFAVFLITLYST
jgi:hypothetical protein